MYLLYKNTGETCLQALLKLKTELKNQVSICDTVGNLSSSVNIDPDKLPSLTYAGRLDPLARGVLLVLEGDEIKNKQSFIDLPKTYEFEVVFGVATDTFDELGVVYPSNSYSTWKTLNFDKDTSDLAEKINKAFILNECSDINEYLQLLKGKVFLHYPFFSSQPIDGIPLFQYSKDHGIDSTNKVLPSKESELISIQCIDLKKIDSEDLVAESILHAQNIKGDFRQDEIIDSWKKFKGAQDLNIMKLRVVCSSGFYIRSLACWLGQVQGGGAIARDIYRTKVGKFEATPNTNFKID